MSDVCHECGCFECECQDSTPELHKKIYALTAQLEASRALLAERDAEIERLRQQSVGWVQVFDENVALRAEVERLKIELEDEQVLASERKIIIDAHTRQTERYENIYRREFEARQQLKAAEEEIRYLDARIADTRKQVAREVEKHLLGMHWTIPYHETEAMIDRDEAIFWVRHHYGLEG